MATYAGHTYTNGCVPAAALARAWDERVAPRLTQEPGDCWAWTGARSTAGYGRITVDGSRCYTHRLAYAVFRGDIPPGLELDHLCRNRACCNPDHLDPVTHAENVRRGQSGQHWAAKTHCPQGHPYAGENLRIDPYGRRKCRTCQSEHARRSARRRAAARMETVA